MAEYITSFGHNYSYGYMYTNSYRYVVSHENVRYDKPRVNMNNLMLYLVMVVSGIIPLIIIIANIGVLSYYRREFWVKGDLDKVTEYDFRIRKTKVFLKYFAMNILVYETSFRLLSSTQNSKRFNLLYVSVKYQVHRKTQK